MSTVRRQIEAVRTSVGLWSRDDHTVLQFRGADAGAWLHAQTTNDVAGLASGEGHLNSFLDRQGRLCAFFSLHRWEDEYWMIVAKSQREAVLARVESHVIMEEVVVEAVGDETLQLLVEGPGACLLLAEVLEGTPEVVAGQLPREAFSFVPLLIGEHEVLAFRRSVSGEDGFVLIPGPGEEATVFGILESALPSILGEVIKEPAQETVRIEGAMVSFGVEVDERCIISETPLRDVAVSDEKGCYQGQEVVARLKAYGALKRSLVGLTVGEESAVVPAAGDDLFDGEKRVGEVRSRVFSPTVGSWIALVYLDRDHRTPREVAKLGVGTPENVASCGVVALPFYTPKSGAESALALYGEALKVFERDEADEDETPITLLTQAILLDPTLEDAYEALGVILHRHHRVDEAIRYMKALERLNPNCVMAHTNLSVFYMTKGMIEEAESEKAIAEQLEAHHRLDARKAEERAHQERQEIERQAEERIGMFEEVLEIDPEDSVATMGLGAAYMQLNRHDAAVGPLETAIRVNKDYSVAYLKLGQCFEALGKVEDAVETYRRGIAAASRKGDLIPMRQMEQRLKGIG